MTKKQKAFYDYLQKLKAEEREDTRFVETALKEFFKYWEKYEKDGVKDSMSIAMESTEAFVGLPVKAHLNSEVESRKMTEDKRNVLRLAKDGEGTCLDCEWGTCLFGGSKGAVCLHTEKKNINELTRCEEWIKRK